MRRLSITRKTTSAAIEAKMKTAQSISDFKRWQIIHLVFNYQVNADFLAHMTGYSKVSVYSIIHQFNNGRGDLSTKSKGGRRRCYLSIEAEKELMKGLEAKARKGQILSCRDIKKTVEAPVGKEVSEDYL